MFMILAWYKYYLFDNMLDTSGVQNIWFNLLWCSSQGEFVALRGKTLQAPQQVAPTSLLQQIQIKWLHTESKQSIVGAHELSYSIFYSKFYFISGNEICCLLLSAPSRCLLHSMQGKPLHAVCMCRGDYCSRRSDDRNSKVHPGLWTWEQRTKDRLNPSLFSLYSLRNRLAFALFPSELIIISYLSITC